MEGGTLVVSGRTRAMGATEVPMLMGSQLQRITFALPDGETASLIKIRPISSKERSTLQAAWSTNGGADGLTGLARASNGAIRFEYSGNAAAYEEIRIQPSGGGASRMVARWVFDTFLKKGAPVKGSETWVQVTE